MQDSLPALFLAAVAICAAPPCDLLPRNGSRPPRRDLSVSISSHSSSVTVADAQTHREKTRRTLSCWAPASQPVRAELLSFHSAHGAPFRFRLNATVSLCPVKRNGESRRRCLIVDYFFLFGHYITALILV